MCEKLDCEFEEFFQHCEVVTNCDPKEMRKLLKPLRNLLLKQQLKRYFKVLLAIASICSAIYFVDTLNWHFCSIARILLIKLLPVWDWTRLSDARCLIAKAPNPSKIVNEFEAFNVKDCRACGTFDTIDVFEQTNYSFIHDKFLVRGLPVIVGDSFDSSNSNESLAEFIENISVKMSEMIKQEACDLETNLMMSKFASVSEAFGILSGDIGDEASWFVSFRNCKFKALKASRLLMPKPYFYPRNLQVPSSSWLLMSQSYQNHSSDLKLFGLILVTQLRGSIRIILRARPECADVCSDITLSLYAGESLVFLSNLWIFSYQYSTERDFAATFITETDLN